jgi:hypothetical protein
MIRIGVNVQVVFPCMVYTRQVKETATWVEGGERAVDLISDGHM